MSNAYRFRDSNNDLLRKVLGTLREGPESASSSVSVSSGSAIEVFGGGQRVILTNLDPAITIYVGGPGVTTGNGFPLLPGDSIILELSGPVFAVSASGSPSLGVFVGVGPGSLQDSEGPTPLVSNLVITQTSPGLDDKISATWASDGSLTLIQIEIQYDGVGPWTLIHIGNASDEGFAGVPSGASDGQSVQLRAYEFGGDPGTAVFSNTLVIDLCSGCEAALTDGGCDTLDCYAEESPIVSPITCGLGWSAGLLYRQNFLGIQGEDFLEAYTDGADVSGLNNGSGWSAAWADRMNFTGLRGTDSLETYADLSAVNGLNDGSGWAAAWVDRDNI